MGHIVFYFHIIYELYPFYGGKDQVFNRIKILEDTCVLFNSSLFLFHSNITSALGSCQHTSFLLSTFFDTSECMPGMVCGFMVANMWLVITNDSGHWCPPFCRGTLPCPHNHRRFAESPWRTRKLLVPALDFRLQWRPLHHILRTRAIQQFQY